MIVVVLMLALTITLIALAYRTTFNVLLGLAHYVAIVGAMLHVAVVLLLTVRIAHAAIVCKNLCSQGKHTAGAALEKVTAQAEKDCTSVNNI
ncbi:hypothetical protein QSH39_010620 [Xanthomonas arboricola pv. corylina]|uniref:hypothetical protein n=1 Tax=Xanthomonas TaxID=338 RepID=UPI000A463062|nr:MULTISPECIES: hypothetical protein [Xanthomonas]MBO9736933.1 hypothetical protein [Xanthomonas phaseoli pv. phaseoli]MCE4289079.1 hypothetical protein [Xanthomonas hortorum pv. vitians]MCE4292899.1 hypothetical protein [Xanthomonas hortorum pv. vitians]MDN0203519.1 hypothetical protein [Xanthomonas arboricola pv. corylina]MDN0217186.1 hypothetical protein [Xanthomonas arboricola pv. corylina]